ncbi:hypothetical protein IKF81_02865 [Candidatus Saccharibacteria bacterium]|nr:hypothetical protein [Candidatus Saccharibacteria bacterium]
MLATTARTFSVPTSNPTAYLTVSSIFSYYHKNYACVNFFHFFHAKDSICPKGWKLPVNGNAQTSKSWINLLFTSYSLQDNDSTSSLNAHKTPLSLVYSGYYVWANGSIDDRGSGGNFWSSTPYSAASAHDLNFYSTRLVPQYAPNKIHGFTIRCVV